MADGFIRRYRTDATAPTMRGYARDVAVRGLLPALALLGLVVVVGMVLLPPGGVGNEAALNRSLQAARTPTLDLIASVVSHTFGVIGAPLIAVVAFFVLRRVTRHWRLALVPLVSVALEALVYQSAALLVARERPEGTEQLDWGLPLASFPSGHVGATTCLRTVFTLLAAASDRPRWVPALWAVLTVACVAAVGWARLYQGMHHASDLVAGVLIGLVAAVIGWSAVRRDPARRAAS